MEDEDTLCRVPTNVIDLMDILCYQQTKLLDIDRFLHKRDNVFRELLEDPNVHRNYASPIVHPDETVRGIYQAQISDANCATETFLAMLRDAAEAVFRATAVIRRERNLNETEKSFRQ